jgi:hypothetical protein
MLVPTLLLWLMAFAFGIALGLNRTGQLPWRAEYAAGIAFPLILAAWVAADARKRQRPLFHDFDSFIFFWWPVILPVYLFQTRGVRAFLTLLCFAGLWIFSGLAGAVIVLIREFVF